MKSNEVTELRFLRRILYPVIGISQRSEYACRMVFTLENIFQRRPPAPPTKIKRILSASSDPALLVNLSG